MRYDEREYKTLIVNGNDLTDNKNIKTALQEITRTVNLQEMNLKNKKIGKMDLTGANLQNANLQGVDMIETILVGANLEGVDLTNSDLTGADLTNANISDADFVNMDLMDASLNGIISSNVYFNNASANDSKFIAITFDSCVFDNTNLRDTNFTDAKFTNVDFHKADLKKANMTNIECTGIVSFEKAKLIDTILVDAKLSGANFEGATLTRTNFTNANLSNTYFNTSLHTAILTGANLSGSEIQSSLENKNLSGVVSLRLAILRNGNLIGANLSGVPLQGADLTGAQLQGADLTGAQLQGTILIGANLEGVIGANLEGAIIAPNDLPAAPQQGIAFQVHNHFNTLNFKKFMKIIRDHIGSSSSEDTLLDPLFIYALSEISKAKSEEIQRIEETISSYAGKDVKAIQDTIKFVMRQPSDFIKTYINNFTEDCLNAYSTGNKESCVKGKYERIFMNLEGILEAHCLDVQDEAMCPPIYKELLLCFKPDYNTLFGEWFATQDPDKDRYFEKNPEEKGVYLNQKKLEFRAYAIGKIGERDETEAYIQKNFAGVYNAYESEGGGRRKKRNTKKRDTKKRDTKKRDTKKRQATRTRTTRIRCVKKPRTSRNV
jgi:uncharacterized protein YjbI with pentapeptide repeats